MDITSEEEDDDDDILKKADEIFDKAIPSMQAQENDKEIIEEEDPLEGLIIEENIHTKKTEIVHVPGIGEVQDMTTLHVYNNELNNEELMSKSKDSIVSTFVTPGPLSHNQLNSTQHPLQQINVNNKRMLMRPVATTTMTPNIITTTTTNNNNSDNFYNPILQAQNVMTFQQPQLGHPLQINSNLNSPLINASFKQQQQPVIGGFHHNLSQYQVRQNQQNTVFHNYHLMNRLNNNNMRPEMILPQPEQPNLIIMKEDSLIKRKTMDSDMFQNNIQDGTTIELQNEQVI